MNLDTVVQSEVRKKKTNIAILTHINGIQKNITNVTFAGQKFAGQGRDRLTECITTNKASGGGGIPAQVFKVLKDDAVEVLHSIYQQMWKLSSGHGTGKGQFSFQSQRKATPKNAQTTVQLHSFQMRAR